VGVSAGARNRSAGVRALLFDFGGVLATEGFREGLKALAGRFGLDRERVYRAGAEVVYASGYVLGRGSEEDFWRLLCRETGLPPYDVSFSAAILDHFHLRPRMLAAVRALRRRGYLTAILSDQTDWLDRLEARHRFFREFDRVFNSYHLGKGKRDPTLFTEVVRALGIPPGQALFVDDNPGNVERARGAGLQAILFTEEIAFLPELAEYTGPLAPEG
jgi:putative hydrolase of the HAD superfamily